MQLNEIFDPPKAELTIHNGGTWWMATTYTEDREQLDIKCYQKDGLWKVVFEVDGSDGVLNRGNEFEIFGIVVEALKRFLTERKPTQISFIAREQNRMKLYKRMVKRLLPTWAMGEPVKTHQGWEFIVTKDE